MSDTLAGHPGDIASNIPDYPMARAGGVHWRPRQLPCSSTLSNP